MTDLKNRVKEKLYIIEDGLSCEAKDGTEIQVFPLNNDHFGIRIIPLGLEPIEIALEENTFETLTYIWAELRNRDIGNLR